MPNAKREIRHNRNDAAGRRSAMTDAKIQRRYPIGAELIGEGRTHFRVWAPKAKRLDVVLESSPENEAERTFHPLEAESGGYFSGAIAADAGAFYRFRVNEAETFHPDPASRSQPQGPHRSSCVVDPSRFSWTDQEWKGVKMPGQIIYEMHVGTFTREGTWRAAAKELAELARIGITVIEMMPIADFPGEFGWGYDGVDLFAPCRLYGTPDDLRAFVNEAHSLGLAVILDVVYNHLGPEGNYLRVFSEDYFTDQHENDWGDSLNFDGPNSGPVREFFITNGRYWIDEFHFDGFRFDATQSIIDSSNEYIVGAIGRAARLAAGDRSIILIAENEPQETKLVRPRSEGGDDLDGLWNDDLHHSAMVALSGQHEAYYSDYRGRPQEFISAAKYGYLFQGQPYVMAGGAARHADFRRPSRGIRRVHGESRSGFELGLWRTRALSDFSGPLSRDDRVDPARPLDADAFPRPGIRRVQSVCLFHRYVGRSAGSDSRRAFQIFGSISINGGRGNSEATARSLRSGSIRAVQT